MEKSIGRWYDPMRWRPPAESREQLMEFPDFTAELDSKRMITEQGVEYWRGRDLQGILGYDTWQNFEGVIARAQEACKSMGSNPGRWFSEFTTPTTSGKGRSQLRKDFYLTRFACYLVAMNGEPSKPEIGMAQAYFAIQTRKQEQQETLTEAERRMLKRKQVSDHNKVLAGVAADSGVPSSRFGIFQDSGYRGLYDMTSRAIKAKKGIPAKDNLLDYACFEELAANDFRITQTARQLLEKQVSSERLANEVHFRVGRKVRQTIKDLGNPTPENLPIEPHIKTLVKAEKAKAKAETKPKALKAK